jgi:hypothetical protein
MRDILLVSAIPIGVALAAIRHVIPPIHSLLPAEISSLTAFCNLNFIFSPPIDGLTASKRRSRQQANIFNNGLAMIYAFARALTRVYNKGKDEAQVGKHLYIRLVCLLHPL